MLAPYCPSLVSHFEKHQNKEGKNDKNLSFFDFSLKILLTLYFSLPFNILFIATIGGTKIIKQFEQMCYIFEE